MNFSENKLIFYGLLLISISLFLFTSNKGSISFINNTIGVIVVPFEKAIVSISSFSKHQYDLVVNKENLVIQNNAYFEQLEMLKLENNRLKHLDIENKKLSALLTTSQKNPAFDKTFSNVIGIENKDNSSFFIIDKGSSDNIFVNMPIISSGGLVGRVYDVGYNYSKILPITNINSSISVLSPRTSDIGILTSESILPDSRLLVKYLNLNSELVSGDEIVTSYLSNFFPENLLVAYVDDVFIEDDGLTKTAIVTPVVDFKQLQHLLIITNYTTKDFINKKGGQ